MENFNALLTLSELKTLYSKKPVGICPLYKGSIGVTKTVEATGNPVVLPKYVDLEKLRIDFSPKQAGTGDPSPENVRPISGYDEVTVTRCGKNLLDISLPYSFSNDSSTQFSLDLDLTGTFAFSAQIDFTEPGITSIALFSFVVDGTEQYISSGTINEGKILTGHLSKLKLTNRSNSEGTINEIQLEVGSTPTPYEPYQGNDYTLTLPETIYGGTVDAVTGVGREEWAIVTLSSEFLTTNLWQYGATGAQTSPIIYGLIPMANDEVGDIYCTHFKRSNNIPIENLEYWSNSPYFGNKRMAIRNDEWTSLDDAKTWLDAQASAGTPVQLAYKLATPEPFEISKISIPSLIGENTFFTNGDNMDIIYKESSFWSDEA